MLVLKRVVARVLGSRAGSLLARRFSNTTFNILHRWPAGVESSKRSTFVLSFDCETERDVVVLPKLISQLADAGVVASFALIGKLVEEYPKEHVALVEAGHEVFNHGYSRHSSIDDDGAYSSTLLYNDLTREQIREEIVQGGKTIEAVCGVTPLGFRAPHFGTLGVSNGEIETLHEAITEGGMMYSSSVSSLEYLRLGSRGDAVSVAEFPLASHPDRPSAVLDSWSTVAAFGRNYVPGSLANPMKKLLSRLTGATSPRFASVYLDPAQVVDLPEFVEFLRLLGSASPKVSVLRYCDLIADSPIIQ